MEFVIVTCDGEQRTVFVDNQEQGATDQRLSVPEGLHVFDLGAPVDYAPPFQELLVEGTTHTAPMPVAFTLVDVREALPVRRGRSGTVARKGPVARATKRRRVARKAAAGGKAAGRKKTSRTPAGRKKAPGRKKTAGKTARKKPASRKKR